jgi:hypothetical protein
MNAPIVENGYMTETPAGSTDELKVVLDRIAFRPSLETLTEILRVRPGTKDAEDLEGLVFQAQDIARPKGVYTIAFIESSGEDFVVVNGVRLTSRILRVNIGEAQRVFAYVATCGTELEEWSAAVTDMLQRYWVDQIKEMALRAAIKSVDDDINLRYDPGPTSRMSPGSLDDWPLEEQQELFRLLGDPQADIGVELMESYLMTPTKTVSRLIFSTEEQFESCQLCPRDKCPSRRAPYDTGLYDRKYRP